MPSRVSIIVPAYNAADTLPRCLDALCAQTLADIEVLVIDDGSTDGTAALLRERAAQDSRLTARRLPENRGVSVARNEGLALARGAYIGFCDADDWVEPGMYEALLVAAEAGGAQVAFCPVVKEFSGRSVAVPLPWPDGTLLDAADIRGDLVPRMVALDFDGEEQPLSGYTPRNLFAREVLEGAAFRADIHYAEDLLFIVEALLRAERAAVLGTPYYHYCLRAGSATQRYNPHVPASQGACQEALAGVLAAHDLAEGLAGRLLIRARRNVLTGVINLCLPGTPYPFLRRARAIRALISAPEARAVFRRVPLAALARRQPKQALKYALIRLRLATPLALLYSCVYRAR
jgi:hypothetical protein